MNFKRLVFLWFFLVSLGLILFVGGLILVDPLGIWGAPTIKGFNNYKVKQPQNLDLFKPYQYRMMKPEVVFLGSSRVYVGLAPKDYPEKGVRVYNMGFSSLSLKDSLQYLHFMIKSHKPRKVFLGLDFFQFNLANAERMRSGFSQKRLDAISGSFLSYLIAKLEESSGLRKFVKETVLKSRENKDALLFLDGWDVKRGSALNWNDLSWEFYLKSFMKSYTSFVLSGKNFDYIKAIVEICRSNEISLEVFFNPVSADLLALLWFSGKYKEFENVKRSVAEITPFKDFAVMSQITENDENFYDASHYKSITGACFILSSSNENNDIKTVKPEMIENWLEISRNALERKVIEKRFFLLRNL